MIDEFQPYYAEEKKSEFSIWEYQPQKEKLLPEVNEAEERNKEYELLKQNAFTQGYAEGLAKAKEEIDAKKNELSQWIKLIQNPIQLLDEQLVKEIMHTILWLAEHCIGVALSTHPDKLLGLLSAIKEEIPVLHSHKILAMHPDDVLWIKKEMPETEIPGLHDIIVADPGLKRGDFYLRSEGNELDGRLQTRLTTLLAKYIDK